MANYRVRFQRDIVTPLSNNVSLFINVLNKRLDDLQTMANDSSLATCTVTASGDVKCTNIVYNNPKVWKFSQNRVQKQISSLQTKLEKLKEIQKHLETKRPNFEDNNKENDDDDDDKEEEYDQDEDDSVIDLSTSYSKTQWDSRLVKY